MVSAELEKGYFILKNDSFVRRFLLTEKGPYPDEIFFQNQKLNSDSDYTLSKASDFQLKTSREGAGLSATLSSRKFPELIYRYFIYDTLPGFTFYPPQQVACFCSSKKTVSDPSGIEKEQSDTASSIPEFLEEWQFADMHLKLIHIQLQDRTDQHDNIFWTREYFLYPNENLQLKGCLFALENPESGIGILYLKHAPLPDSRPEQVDFDLEIFSSQNQGIRWNSIRLNSDSYPWTCLFYEGSSAGRTQVLQRFFQQRKPYRPGLDGLFLSNTWGDRNRDMALCERFICNEIRLAAEVGVDVCQIDDGWQNGVSANSGLAAQKGGGMWNGNYHKADGNFWGVHPERFPNGIAPLAERCRELGVGLGLWFSPDSANEFEYWREDSEILLNFNRAFGVKWFKIDGIRADSSLGTERLQEFFRRTSDQSVDGLAFDLDVTAGQRPGYFGLDYPGALFLENRYSDHHTWWPSATFRHVWQLSQIMPPVHLRMELLNPDRHPEMYIGDRLAPSLYSMDWIFASVMLASPLLWCELHGLSEQRKAELKPIVKVWKQYRQELHTSVAEPVGEEPDGFNWSGFLLKNGPVRHLILFRDNTSSDSYTFHLPEAVSETFSMIYGSTGASFHASDKQKIEVYLPEPRSFLWLRMR